MRCAIVASFLVCAHAAHGASPARFAIIFNMGYANDGLPREAAAFERLVKTIKEAHFNVILCSHTAERAAICKKHGVLLFVDLLAKEHHVYINPDSCRKLCASLRDDPTIYGYHLWSDNIAGTAAGRSRDVKNVHEWDGTHPAYVGCYKMSKMGSVTGMDLFGYYDFHWKRGGHWANLTRAFILARERKVPFLRYDDAKPGVVGKGNPNRAGYTIATSIPFGLRGYMYHYAGGIVDPKTGRLDALGQDVKKVNARFASVGAELMKLDVPSAVYSTPITVGPNDKPTGAAAVPGGLTALPKDAPFQVASGEVLIGTCRDKVGRDVLVLANHNPYRSQEVKLALTAKFKRAERYDRTAGAWQALAVVNRHAGFTVEEYAVELVRLLAD